MSNLSGFIRRLLKWLNRVFRSGKDDDVVAPLNTGTITVEVHIA